VIDECLCPAVPDRRLQAVDGRHLPAGYPPCRGDASCSRLTVDEDGAAAALALGLTSVFDRSDPELAPKDVEERATVVDDGDLPAVDGELQLRTRR
jgi:hypothetical protein